jgi:AI-2 transport protein TqsA
MTDQPAPASQVEGPRPAPRRPKWREPGTFTAVATITQVLIAVAAAWFMLQQLAPLLRPFFVAVFLAYVLMPYHSRLRTHIGAPASIGVLAGLTALALLVLALVVYASVLGLSDQMPRLQQRASDMTHQLEDLVGQAAPWTDTPGADGRPTQATIAEHVARITAPILTSAADALLEACVVALYLLFLLLEGSRFPDRVRRAYTPERAEEILDIAGKVSSAIISYLRAKVKSSLVLAIPVGLVLWMGGVKFALLWAILTFLCNFIPYIGSVIAFTLPVGFAFLLFGLRWEPVAAALLLLLCHVGSASVVEPLIIGNAVGLSPLVILASLAFWGLLWGIPGMFLAVPLTVVATIVMDHFATTRPVARLLQGGR